MLQDIRSNNRLLGGLPIIIGGDLLKSYLLFVKVPNQ